MRILGRQNYSNSFLGSLIQICDITCYKMKIVCSLSCYTIYKCWLDYGQSYTLFRIIPVQRQEVKGGSLSGCIKDDPISRSLAGQQLAVILCISQHAYRLQRLLVEQNKVKTNITCIMLENQNTKGNINVRTQTGRLVYESRESGVTAVKWPWINWRSLL